MCIDLTESNDSQRTYARDLDYYPASSVPSSSSIPPASGAPSSSHLDFIPSHTVIVASDSIEILSLKGEGNITILCASNKSNVNLFFSLNIETSNQQINSPFALLIKKPQNDVDDYKESNTKNNPDKENKYKMRKKQPDEYNIRFFLPFKSFRIIGVLVSCPLGQVGGDALDGPHGDDWDSSGVRLLSVECVEYRVESDMNSNRHSYHSNYNYNDDDDDDNDIRNNCHTGSDYGNQHSYNKSSLDYNNGDNNKRNHSDTYSDTTCVSGDRNGGNNSLDTTHFRINKHP